MDLIRKVRLLPCRFSSSPLCASRTGGQPIRCASLSQNPSAWEFHTSSRSTPGFSRTSCRTCRVASPWQRMSAGTKRLETTRDPFHTHVLEEQQLILRLFILDDSRFGPTAFCRFHLSMCQRGWSKLKPLQKKKQSPVKNQENKLVTDFSILHVFFFRKPEYNRRNQWTELSVRSRVYEDLSPSLTIHPPNTARLILIIN